MRIPQRFPNDEVGQYKLCVRAAHVGGLCATTAYRLDSGVETEDD